MKKRIRIMTLALPALLLLGGCAFHWKGKIPDYEEQVYFVDAPSALDHITLKDQDTPVEICPSEDGRLSVSYYLPDDGSEDYRIVRDGRALTVAKESSPNHGIFIFGDEANSESFRDVRLMLYLPDNFSGDLSVETRDGNISIKSVSVKNLKLSTRDGTVTFWDTDISQSLSCQTTDGDITGLLPGISGDYSVRIQTSANSSLSDGGSGKRTIDLSTKNGDITLSFSE